MKLYSYWRSSAAYRVRIALNLKDIEHEIVPVSLIKDGGEHRQPAYLAVNPQGLVPTLVDDETTIGQSGAILEYLEETVPEPALLPPDAAARARVRQIMNIVCCDIHPLNNLRVLLYLKNELAMAQDAVDAWYAKWIQTGFAAMETLIANGRAAPSYCVGETPTLADVCLIPQVYNARRFKVDLTEFPLIQHIVAQCNELNAFQAAQPEAQVDADS